MLDPSMEGVLETTNYTTFRIRNDEGHCCIEFSGANKAHNALHGDRVSWNMERQECVLLGRTQHPILAGKLELNSKTKYGMTSRGSPLYLFVPFHKSYPMMIVGCSERDTRQNRIALVEFEEWNTTGLARGILRQILGPIGQDSAEQEALLWTYNPFKYSSKQLSAILTSIPTPEKTNRVLHPPLCFNIDPEGCKDVDDVIGLRVDEHTTELWITISDVAEFVQEGSPLDHCAQKQGSTCYAHGEAVRPMLPFHFSEEVCSLLPGDEKLGMSLVLTYATTDLSKPISKRWVECVLQNDTSYSYESFLTEAQKDGIPVYALHDMAKGLLPSVLFTDVHTWIEAFMLIYNLEVAKLLRERKAGILRKHGIADYERLVTYSQWGIPSLAQQAAEYCAADDATPLHYGLTADVYCHATSPIRRYADLVNQRVLKSILRGEQPSIRVSTHLLTHLNGRLTDMKRFERDLFLMEQLRDTTTKEIRALVLDRTEKVYQTGNRSDHETRLKLWVPAWKRVLTWSTLCPIPQEVLPGLTIRLSYFAHPDAVRWKNRIAFRFESIWTQ